MDFVSELDWKTSVTIHLFYLIFNNITTVIIKITERLKTCIN